MMNLSDIQSVYFIGAGGIGMSALVRYFLSKGKAVAGYDRTPTSLTESLTAEGAQIHYEENAALIPDTCRNPATTLVVYTPAVPATHAELTWFRGQHKEAIRLEMPQPMERLLERVVSELEKKYD